MSNRKHGNPVPMTVWFNGDNAKALIDAQENISKRINRLVTEDRIRRRNGEAQAEMEEAFEAAQREKIRELQDYVRDLELNLMEAREKILALEETSSRYHYEAACARRELGVLRRKYEGEV